MLRITQEQMGTFAVESEFRTVAWHADRLTRRFPSLPTLVQPPLDDFIRHTRGVARSLGIDREEDIAFFLDLAVMYGPHFHEQQWAAQWLSISALHGHDRVALLRHEIDQVGIQI